MRGNAPAIGERPAGRVYDHFVDAPLAVGFITGESGKTVMQPFTGDLFKGLLSFFLLDMGLIAARRFRDARAMTWRVAGLALILPICNGLIGVALATAVGLDTGSAAALGILAGSASYIAVPAVLRYALPEANPSLYFGLSLGITFPLNIVFGIPIYVAVAQGVLM